MQAGTGSLVGDVCSSFCSRASYGSAMLWSVRLLSIDGDAEYCNRILVTRERNETIVVIMRAGL